MSRRSPRPNLSGVKRRKIGDVYYYQDGDPDKTKAAAEKHAARYKERGYLVRIFPSADGYQVYVV